MSLLLLDMSIASAIIGQRAQLAQLERADWCIPASTRAELQFGVMRRLEATRLARLLEAFLAAARTEPFGERAADEYGRVR